MTTKTKKVTKAKKVSQAKKSEGIKDGYSPKEFSSVDEILQMKLKRETKASILLNFCLDKINKKQKEISVDFKSLFKDAKSERIKGSIYGDKRFPAYVLKLAKAEKDYFVRDKVIKEVSKDGNSGGVVPEALLGFKFILKEKSSKK